MFTLLKFVSHNVAARKRSIFLKLVSHDVHPLSSTIFTESLLRDAPWRFECGRRAVGCRHCRLTTITDLKQIYQSNYVFSLHSFVKETRSTEFDIEFSSGLSSWMFVEDPVFAGGWISCTVWLAARPKRPESDGIGEKQKQLLHAPHLRPTALVGSHQHAPFDFNPGISWDYPTLLVQNSLKTTTVDSKVSIPKVPLPLCPEVQIDPCSCSFIAAWAACAAGRFGGWELISLSFWMRVILQYVREPGL